MRPDGKISLPLLHDLQASGLTALQLRDKLAVAMAEFMPNPELSVIVNEVRSFRVSLLGEVQKPGVLQLKSTTRRSPWRVGCVTLPRRLRSSSSGRTRRATRRGSASCAVGGQIRQRSPSATDANSSTASA